MKKSFKGTEVSSASEQWAERTAAAKWLSDSAITLAQTPEHRIKTYVHPEYAACEYKLRLNVFSFGRLRLNLSFIVIAPPVSVDECGFCGDLDRLIDDYKRRKGLFLMLNLRADQINVRSKAAMGKTLPSCVLDNRFQTFDSYLNALRSSYRRRISIALDKGAQLEVKRIDNTCFNDALYHLYLQVLKKSDFPLEQLPIQFFQHCRCDIDVFYHSNVPLAFVMHETSEDAMTFLFGGMDYAHRDQYDLYYNMLLYMIQSGIDSHVPVIHFGQTAEAAKCRVGCHLEDRFMIAFSGNRFLTHLLRMFAPLLQNSQNITKFHVFRH